MLELFSPNNSCSFCDKKPQKLQQTKIKTIEATGETREALEKLEIT